ncbi:MAG: hypothetical protein GXO45_03685 [Aquificae bacterium]|nr:hypothetical protein [Aquificota bacterium]
MPLPKQIKKLFTKKRKGVGIQVGKRFIRLAVLNNKQKITEFFTLETVDDPKQAGILLGEEIEKRKLHIDTAYISLPSNLTIFKTVKLPLIPQEEIPEAVEWHIKDDVYDLKEEVVYDYHITHKDQQGLTLLVVMAKKSPVERVKKVVEQVGIKPQVITAEGIAVLNLVGDKEAGILHIDREGSLLIQSGKGITVHQLTFATEEYNTLPQTEKERALSKLIDITVLPILSVNGVKELYLSGEITPEMEEYIQVSLGRITSIQWIYKDKLSQYTVPIGLAYQMVEDD